MMDAVTALMQQIGTGMAAFVLAFARPFSAIIFLPLFSWTRLTGILRVGFAVAVALPVTRGLYVHAEQLNGLDQIVLVSMVAKEVGIGVILGFIMGLPFHGVQAAGDWIDVTRGASNSNLFDPMRAEESSESGTLFMVTSLALFVGAGGILIVIDFIYGSYNLWPVLSVFPEVTAEVEKTIKSKLTDLFQLAIIVGSPMVLLLMITDFTLMFASRSSRPLNLFDLSQTFKNLIIVIMMPMFIMFFGYYFEQTSRLAIFDMRTLLRMEPGPLMPGGGGAP